jgi:inosine/xanthosine triphosphate pyrophosphatase family protein
MTTAQMSPERKHAISHRGQALRRLREQLARLLEEQA